MRNNFRINLIFFSGTALLILFITLQTCRRALSRISRDFFYPFINVPVLLENEVSDKSLLLWRKKQLAAAVEQLRSDNEKLRAKIAISKNLAQENKKLRALLDLGKRNEYDCVFADIILRDPTFWNERFSINKGLNDQVQLGSVVLSSTSSNKAPEHLAVLGRITAVSKHSAVVSTIISEECRLGVVLPDSHTHGVIQGGGRDQNSFWVKVSYLPRNAKYKPGEPVYTSGLTQNTPGALFIGRLRKDSNKVDITLRDNLYFEGRIRPVADLESLRHVMVMVRRDDN